MLRPLHPCHTIGCHALTRERYCANHIFQMQDDNAARQKYYDKHKRDKKSDTFYRSTAWLKTRHAAMMRDHGLCQHCLADGKATVADMVHHIVEVKIDWDKRLELDNLTCLCHACHNRVDHKQ